MTVIEETTLGAPVVLRYDLDRNGVATDPDRLTCSVRSYQGATVAIGEWSGSNGDIIKDATGRFHTEVLPPSLGHYVFRFEAFDASDVQIGASEGEFIVRTIYR